MLIRTMATAFAALAFGAVAGTASAATPFGTDVNTAIDRGLAYLESQGAYTAYPGCGGSVTSSISYVRGMPLTALLEKRASGDLTAAPQGYSGASPADQEKMRNAAACILDAANEISQEAYYYGNWLMGLSLYARTGGLDKGAPGIPNDADLMGLVEAIDKLTDDLVNAQCPDTYGTASYRGMWYYSGCGDDSSTTQFAAAGLAAAKGYYLAKGDPGGRVAKINASLALASKHYADFGATGSDNDACSVMDANERGHGYHNGYAPSLQQTASGLWVQQLGGANVNSAGVQAYLRWMRNHYRWQDLDDMGNFWPDYSYYYYLWSSMKGLLTIKESGITPAAGNLGADAYGTLGPLEDANTADALPGTCAVRQVHRDPATLARPAVFGAGGAGFYSGEPKSTYFDYAYSLLGYQCANGAFQCNGAPSTWTSGATSASWGLLVLLRSTGGACADADNNGICDEDQDENAEILLCDANADTNVSSTDIRAVYNLLLGKYPVAIPVTSQNAWANYNTNGASANTIDINDFWGCYYVATGKLPKKYATIPD